MYRDGMQPRRDFLHNAAQGIGSLAFATLFGQRAAADNVHCSRRQNEFSGSTWTAASAISTRLIPNRDSRKITGSRSR